MGIATGASKIFFGNVSDLINTCRLDILFLLETRVQSNRAQHVMRMEGFVGFAAAEARGFGGGIWCL